MNYAITVRLKNNALLSRISEKHNSLTEFCHAAGISVPEVSSLINLTYAPVRENREWRNVANAIALALKTPREMLFPHEFRWVPLQESRFTIVIPNDEWPLEYEKLINALQEAVTALRQPGVKTGRHTTERDDEK